LKSDNPWRRLPHDIYEKHMGHENVRQLQALSLILGEQLALVSDILNPIVAILGITGGNGLENVEKGRYKRIIGMDINSDYLDICRERYDYLSELALYQIDLTAEKDRAAEILKDADLVTANLLVKHIHLCNFVDIVIMLTKPVVSVTVQFNPDGRPVSNSGYEAAFDGIQLAGEECGEEELTAAMRGAGYDVIGRAEYIMPNEKALIRLDYKRRRAS